MNKNFYTTFFHAVAAVIAPNLLDVEETTSNENKPLDTSNEPQAVQLFGQCSALSKEWWC